MKKTLLPILVLMILLSLTACGSDGANPAAEGDSGSFSSQEEPARSSDSYSSVSMNRFKDVASDFGTAQDVSDDFGFDACMVEGEDGTDYIYMYLSSSDMAEQLITDGNGDGMMDPGLKIIRAGANYEFYTEYYENEEKDTTVCGYYVRVDNMLIFVTGEKSEEEKVRSNAETLFGSLGYSMN